MDFNLSKENELVVQTAREFAEKVLKPVAAENDENGTFSFETYQKMAKIGLVGIPFAKEYEGTGGEYISYILAVEEISKVDASMGIAFSVNTSLCAGGIYHSASEEQKKKYIPDLATGRKIGSFGLTESNAGTDAGGVQTVAVRDGNNYILNGQKCFITNSPLAETFLVFASTDPTKGSKGLSCFIVEKDFPGISIGKIENKMGIRSAQVGEVIFKDCVVPAENLVGEEGQGFKIAMKTLDGGRIGVGAQALGIAEGAFEEAKKYMMERKQFGKPLSAFQGLQWRMAELYKEIEQARYLLYKAAMDKGTGKPYSISAAMAKWACSDAAMHVTTEAIQMIGGLGYMKERPLERMMRDAKITQIYEGTNEVQRMVVSGSIFR